jgi:hypothetical protein
MTPDSVSQVFQDRIVTGKAVVTADNARTAAVKSDKDKRTQTRGVALAFRRLLIALFAQDPTILGDFAISAPKKGQRTAADKANAAAKGKTTRPEAGNEGDQAEEGRDPGGRGEDRGARGLGGSGAGAERTGGRPDGPRAGRDADREAPELSGSR